MVNKKLGLICSSGGHFLELYSLKQFWNDYDRFWITFREEDTLYFLEGEKAYFAFSPTNRNLKNFTRNLLLAPKLILKEKPSVLISTGAGVCVPFFFAAKFLGIKTVYVESVTRVNDLSLSGKLVYFLVDKILVQWVELAEKYRKAEFYGRLI